MEIHWESELAELLGRLSRSQQQLLSLLSSKHDLLTRRDHKGLAELVPKEEALCAELQACHQRRQQLLEQAELAGLPSDSIQSLSESLPEEEAKQLRLPMEESIERSRLLRHQSVAQWVVVQRTLLHLSHLLEIFATGGQTQPTYREGGATESSGALIDQAM